LQVGNVTFLRLKAKYALSLKKVTFCNFKKIEKRKKERKWKKEK